MRLLAITLQIFLGWNSMAASLKVQTFNTYGPIYARHLETRTRGLFHILRVQKSDIYGLQEVWEPDHSLSIQNGMKTIEPMINKLDFDYRHKVKTGLRIFSKGELVSFETLDYPINQEGVLDQVRGFFGVIKALGIAHIKMPDFENILVVNTHTHPLSQSVRIAQVVFLVETVLKHRQDVDHIIIMGDFNFTPSSIEYRLLTGLLALEDSFLKFHQNYNNHCTYCENNEYHWGGKSRVIDYIFYKSLGNQQLIPISSEINLKSYQGKPISDHYGVHTELALSPKLELKPSDTPKNAIEESLKLLESRKPKSKYQNTIQKLKEWLRQPLPPITAAKGAG